MMYARADLERESTTETRAAKPLQAIFGSTYESFHRAPWLPSRN
jgi:hypothetical protein